LGLCPCTFSRHTPLLRYRVDGTRSAVLARMGRYKTIPRQSEMRTPLHPAGACKTSIVLRCSSAAGQPSCTGGSGNAIGTNPVRCLGGPRFSHAWLPSASTHKRKCAPPSIANHEALRVGADNGDERRALRPGEESQPLRSTMECTRSGSMVFTWGPSSMVGGFRELLIACPGVAGGVSRAGVAPLPQTSAWQRRRASIPGKPSGARRPGVPQSYPASTSY
jgi:hypothetical protein